MKSTWIPLLVPQEDYLELAQLVADRVADRGSPFKDTVTLSTAVTPYEDVSGSIATAEQVSLSKLEPWPLKDLGRLSESTAITAQRWALAMDVCCEHVNIFLSTQEIAQEAGMTVNEWRDAPRKISRHLKANYPSVSSWPLAGEAGRTLGHADDQAYWAINSEQAARWIQVRSKSR